MASIYKCVIYGILLPFLPPFSFPILLQILAHWEFAGPGAVFRKENCRFNHIVFRDGLTILSPLANVTPPLVYEYGFSCPCLCARIFSEPNEREREREREKEERERGERGERERREKHVCVFLSVRALFFATNEDVLEDRILPNTV